jgi:hypothetical protein
MIEQQLAPWLEATRSLAAAFEAIHWRHECQQISGYLRNCASEVENATKLASPEWHTAVTHVRDGNLPLPRDLETFVPPTVVKPELVQLFALFALEWTDADGMLRQSAKWLDVELPPETAAHALRLKLCAPMSDPRRQQLRGQGSGRPPEPNWLNNIDNETGPNIATPSAALDPIRHAAFTPIDRGKGFTLKVARDNTV